MTKVKLVFYGVAIGVAVEWCVWMIVYYQTGGFCK